MKVLFGKNIIDFPHDELLGKIIQFKRVHIDIGTGDGKQIYYMAKQSPETLFIGIDPARDNMSEMSGRVIRKKEKGGLDNILFVISSLETIAEQAQELAGIADSISLILPWGSLLEAIVKPDIFIVKNIVFLAKATAPFEFILTYSDSFEGGEMVRRNLPEISTEYFQSENYLNELQKVGLNIQNVNAVDNEFILQNFKSLWAKRLAHGRKRDFFYLRGVVSHGSIEEV